MWKIFPGHARGLYGSSSHHRPRDLGRKSGFSGLAQGFPAASALPMAERGQVTAQAMASDGASPSLWQLPGGVEPVVLCLQRSEGAPSGTKANGERGWHGKARAVSSVNLQKRQRTLGWSLLSPSTPDSEGAEDSPRPWFLPTVVGPRRPRLTARRAPPAAAGEWSGPSVAATRSDSYSCSRRSVSSAGVQSGGCHGRWAGGGELRTTSAGCRARAAARGEASRRGSSQGTACSGDARTRAGVSSPWYRVIP
ncbi:uncharacterized protein LOC144577203 [Callithrix jacchus]